MARIFECIRIFVEVLHSNTLTNECPNIFAQTNLTRTSNECPNIFVKEKLIRMNVRIYKVKLFENFWKIWTFLNCQRISQLSKKYQNCHLDQLPLWAGGHGDACRGRGQPGKKLKSWRWEGRSALHNCCPISVVISNPYLHIYRAPSSFYEAL